MLTRVTLELRVFWTQTQPSNLFSSSGPHWKSHTDLQLNHPTSETNTKSPTLTELEEQGVQRIYETCFVAFLKRFSWFLVLLLCFKKLVLYKRKSGTQRAAWGLKVGVEHDRHRAPKKLALRNSGFEPGLLSRLCQQTTRKFLEFHCAFVVKRLVQTPSFLLFPFRLTTGLQVTGWVKQEEGSWVTRPRYLACWLFSVSKTNYVRVRRL